MANVHHTSVLLNTDGEMAGGSHSSGEMVTLDLPVWTGNFLNEHLLFTMTKDRAIELMELLSEVTK